MSHRRVMGIELGMLLALGLFLLNAACPNLNTNPTVVAGGVDFEGLLQSHDVEVDDGSDGTPEASDSGTLVGGLSDPGVLGEATSPVSGASVRAEVTSDEDSALTTCQSVIPPGLAQRINAECRAEDLHQWDLELTRANAEYTASLSVTPANPPSGIDVSYSATVSADCGSGPSLFVIDDTDPVRMLSVPVDPAATDCSFQIVLDSSVSAEAGAAGTFIVTATITAHDVAPRDCAHHSECPASHPNCGPQGKCQKGIEGEQCTLPSVHCEALFCTLGTSGNQCSDGDAGSFARGSFECATGYVYSGGECLGDPCTSDVDCPPERPICTERGCSATGEHMDGCFQGFGCRSGLCIANVCNLILGLGEDCSVPHSVCEAAYRCFADGTCQVPLPAGSSCNANQECQNPLTHTCLMGTCQPRSPFGGFCEENGDCVHPWICLAGMNECGS